MKLPWGRIEDKADHDRNVTNYTIYSENALLNQFESSTWNKLSQENRIAVIQELENRNAKMQGREAAEVLPLSNPRYYGGYSDVGNRISIDVENFTSYEVLDTYVHESNHAYQSHCIKNNLEQGYAGNTYNMLQVEMARDEQGRLYNYAEDSPMYDMQYNELDSNNKAASFMLAQRERYQSDSKYADYIEERAEHFRYVNDSLKQNRDERIVYQNMQINNAYIRGDVSKGQYDELLCNINQRTEVDAAVLESQSVGEILDTVDMELKQEEGNNMVDEHFDYTGGIEAGKAGLNDSFDYTSGAGYIDMNTGSMTENYGNDGSEIRW